MSLENRIYKLCLEKKYRIVTAESCTGGLVAATIINVSGASNILDMSFVTYSNKAKETLIGVNPKTIETYNVVSEEVALEMARGAKERANSNIALSTTGLAGPHGDGVIKVGTVCFGIVINNQDHTYTHVFKNISRQYVRKAAVKFILRKLLALLEAQ